MPDIVLVPQPDTFLLMMEGSLEEFGNPVDWDDETFKQIVDAAMKKSMSKMGFGMEYIGHIRASDMSGFMTAILSDFEMDVEEKFGADDARASIDRLARYLAKCYDESEYVDAREMSDEDLDDRWSTLLYNDARLLSIVPWLEEGY